MTTERMVGFGGKQAWLAIRSNPGSESSSAEADIVAALGLRDLGEAPWRDGLDLAHLTDDRVAVTPAIDGWILATGRYLLRPDVRVDVVELSARLRTEVQFFATHRVTETHRWQRAVAGDLIRAFGYVGRTGEVTSWFGDPDDAEQRVGLPVKLDEDTTVLVGENDVLQVAGAWSIDPSTLSGRAASGPLHLGAAA